MADNVTVTTRSGGSATLFGSKKRGKRAQAEAEYKRAQEYNQAAKDKFDKEQYLSSLKKKKKKKKGKSLDELDMEG